MNFYQEKKRAQSLIEQLTKKAPIESRRVSFIVQRKHGFGSTFVKKYLEEMEHIGLIRLDMGMVLPPHKEARNDGI